MVLFNIFKNKKILELLRAKYYSLFFNIGYRCKFGKGVKLYGETKSDIIIGNRVVIFRNTELCASKDLPIIIGNNVLVNQRCIIRKNVRIGNNVDIAPNVSLMTDTHEIGDENRRAGESKYPPIVIEDGCWIGANTIILGGATVGFGTIIGAGAVVTSNCEPNSLYVGVPARLVKKLDRAESINIKAI